MGYIVLKRLRLHGNRKVRVLLPMDEAIKAIHSLSQAPRLGDLEKI